MALVVNGAGTVVFVDEWKHWQRGLSSGDLISQPIMKLCSITNNFDYNIIIIFHLSAVVLCRIFCGSYPEHCSNCLIIPGLLAVGTLLLMQ